MKGLYKQMQSPVGNLTLVASAGRLMAISWEDRPPKPAGIEELEPDSRDPVLVEAARQLKEYFVGKRRRFDLPIPKTLPGTAFQNRVWRAMRSIPYGKTASYGQIARRIGSPSACRAVGAACGRNPLPIVIPCHRVIGQSGSLTGFGGGLTRKRTLLDLERPAL